MSDEIYNSPAYQAGFSAPYGIGEIEAILQAPSPDRNPLYYVGLQDRLGALEMDLAKQQADHARAKAKEKAFQQYDEEKEQSNLTARIKAQEKKDKKDLTEFQRRRRQAWDNSKDDNDLSREI